MAKTSTASIIIVGAGAAGLSAARYLKQHGQHALILEARDCIGGRVRTIHDFSVPVDLGAAWLHCGPKNPLKKIAQEISLERRVSDFFNLAVYDIQSEGSFLDPLKAAESLSAGLEVCQKAMKPASLWPYLRTIIGRSVGLGGSRMSIADLLEQAATNLKGSQGSLQYLTFMRIFFEALYASPTEELGFASLLTESATEPEGGMLPVDDQFVTGGMEKILNYLAQELEVQFNQVVNHIAYDRHGIEIQTQNKTFKANAVIVTVPIGVLRSGQITFEPSLPRLHQQALQYMDMGLVNRVVLQFPHVFWPESVDILAMCNSSLRPMFINYAHYKQVPVLISIVGGQAAQRIEALSDIAIAQEFCSELQRILQVTVPEPTKVVVQRWKQEEFARGSYPRYLAGATGLEPKHLATPIKNRVFFAGDATSLTEPGYLHGAFWSGELAAQRLCKM
ncbi:MAG: FAD-dependent oxidoreductase [Leptolyngbya sp. SIO3F4]|nr:FAD-dependent oxidoreductase [Leptolyngbya sp. SIO3F4]